MERIRGLQSSEESEGISSGRDHHLSMRAKS
jgi:hypothetical protein